MALILEDGSQVTGANSYVTDAEYTTYAALRGLTVGVDEPTREIELIKAMDFIESHRRTFKGIKVSKDQPLQWPRAAVWVDSFPVNATEIPDELKSAQIEAGIAVSSSIDLLRNENNQNLKREKVDVIEREFHSGGSWQNIRLDRVNVLLKALLRVGSFGISAGVVRA